MIRKNSRLKVRQEDEALLYKAEKCNLSYGECGDIMCLQWSCLQESVEEMSGILWEEVYEECYLVSRYRDILLKWDKFNFMIENILEKAQICKREEAAVLMEQMMLRQGDYYWIEEAGCPILLYKGEDICYDVLNKCAEQLGAAFERNGQEVEYFDVGTEEIQELTRFIGKHFRAVIGMQTYLFEVKLEDDSFLHDQIRGPKYNFVFDHPVWMKNHLKDFHVITHDINYLRFIEKYYHLDSCLLPPAGAVVPLGNWPKSYDVSFVGTYRDYWSEVLQMHAMDRRVRFVANRFLLELRKHTCFTAEEALMEVYRKKGLQPGDEEFLSMLRELRRVYYCVMYYYRYHIIKELLEAGLRIDVFGESWQTCPLRIYPNLVCHPGVGYEGSIQVWQQSKLSLNIMSWHKGGFTERMANIMLCKTALVTDDTTYLHGRYTPDEDLIVFHLDELEKLPEKLKRYLEDDRQRQEIAENGWKKACQYETWDVRVREMERTLL